MNILCRDNQIHSLQQELELINGKNGKYHEGYLL